MMRLVVAFKSIKRELVRDTLMSISSAHSGIAYHLDFRLDVGDYELVFALLLPEHVQLHLQFLQQVSRVNVVVLFKYAVLLLKSTEHTVIFLHLRGEFLIHFVDDFAFLLEFFA